MLSEISQRKTNTLCMISLICESKKNPPKQNPPNPKLTDTENRLVVARVAGAWGEMGEGSQKVQTSGYKLNKSWGCNVQHGNYS